MTHITDYGGAIDDYYPARIERIADMDPERFKGAKHVKQESEYSGDALLKLTSAAIDSSYSSQGPTISEINDMELTELEKRADIEAEKSRMKPEVLDPPAKGK